MRLAQLADMPLHAVTRLSSSTRDKLLEHHTATLAARRQHEHDALWARLIAGRSAERALEPEDGQ